VAEQPIVMPEKNNEAFSLSAKHKMEQQLLKCTSELREKNLLIEQLKRRLADQERKFEAQIADLTAKIKDKNICKSLIKGRPILDNNETFTADTKSKQDCDHSIHSDKHGLGSPRFDEIRHYSFKASKVFAEKIETKSQSPIGRNGTGANDLLSVMDGSSMSFNKDSNFDTMQKELKHSETVL